MLLTLITLNDVSAVYDIEKSFVGNVATAASD